MDELISRQAAIDALDGEIEVTGKANAKAVLKYTQMVSDRLKALPSAQTDLDEWCTDCKEYDQERHCCPRWNRVIRKTAEELRQNAEPRWIPVTERKPQRRSYVVVTDCDGVEEAYYSSDGTWFDTLGDKLKDVTAWMSLPESYRGGEE